MYTDVQLLINGEWCDGAEGKSEPIVNPATGQVLARLAHASPSDPVAPRVLLLPRRDARRDCYSPERRINRLCHAVAASGGALAPEVGGTAAGGAGSMLASRPNAVPMSARSVSSKPNSGGARSAANHENRADQSIAASLAHP